MNLDTSDEKAEEYSLLKELHDLCKPAYKKLLAFYNDFKKKPIGTFLNLKTNFRNKIIELIKNSSLRLLTIFAFVLTIVALIVHGIIDPQSIYESLLTAGGSLFIGGGLLYTLRENNKNRKEEMRIKNLTRFLDIHDKEIDKLRALWNKNVSESSNFGVVLKLLSIPCEGPNTMVIYEKELFSHGEKRQILNSNDLKSILMINDDNDDNDDNSVNSVNDDNDDNNDNNDNSVNSANSVNSVNSANDYNNDNSVNSVNDDNNDNNDNSVNSVNDDKRRFLFRARALLENLANTLHFLKEYTEYIFTTIQDYESKFNIPEIHKLKHDHLKNELYCHHLFQLFKSESIYTYMNEYVKKLNKGECYNSLLELRKWDTVTKNQNET